MSNIIANTNYVGQGVARLLFCLRDKPRVTALLTSYLSGVQQLENAAIEFYALRMLQNGAPTGDLLDKLGKLVGQAREGFVDADYLLLITARIKANRSGGRHEDLIAIANLLIPGAQIVLRDFPPAAAVMVVMGPVPFTPYLIALQFLIVVAASAGVYLQFGWTSVPLAATLILGYGRTSTTPTPTVAQSPGWSGSSSIKGGALGGLIAG